MFPQRIVSLVLCTVLAAGAVLFAGTPQDPFGHDVVVPQVPTSARKAPVGVTYSGTEGDIVLMALSGDYNRDNPDGSFNLEARTAVGQTFYAHHEDAYDFLVVFTTFEFNTGEARAFYVSLFNDIAGIGQDPIDLRDLFGGSRMLQGYIDMAATGRYELDALQPDYDATLDTLLHETMHRWGVHARYDDNGTTRDDLLGYQDAHWGQYVFSDASIMGGARWADNGDGSFTALDVRYGYHALDLYFAGFLPLSQVPDIRFLRDASGDPDAYWPTIGDTTPGTAVTVTPAQILTALGPRVPDHQAAQHDFRAAFIVLTQPGEEVPPTMLAEINDLRRAYATRFSVLTRGRGVMRTALADETGPSTGTPDTVSGGPGLGRPADFDAAVAWLLDRAQSGGYWQDKPLTRVLDTVHALRALDLLNVDDPRLDEARAWLRRHIPANHDERAWLLAADVLQGETGPVVADLLAGKTPGGGWGLVTGLRESNTDTALVLGRLAAGALAPADVLDAAAGFLTAQGMEAWGPVPGGVPTVDATVQVMDALLHYGIPPEQLESARLWLLARRNPDGSFGQAEGAGHVTARVLQLLSRLPATSPALIEATAQVLENLQTEDGSWDGSVYATAQALAALRGRQNPNLKISGGLTQTPAQISDGDQVTTRFQVQNNGLLATEAVTARLYAGDPLAGGTPLGDAAAVPALAPGEAVFIDIPWDSLNTAPGFDLTAWVDADQLIAENNEADNRVAMPLTIADPPAGADLNLLGGSLQFAPLTVSRLPETLQVDVPLRNSGQTDITGAAVVLQLQVDDGPWETAAALVVDAPGRTTQPLTLTGTLTQAGQVRGRVVADPDQLINEADETNNLVAFAPAMQPSLDLTVLPEDLSLTAPALSGEDAVFSAVIRNRGTSPSPQVQLQAFVGGDAGTQQILSTTVQLAPGEVSVRQLIWRAGAPGAYQLRVAVDTEHAAVEGDETNNEAVLDFAVAGNSLPNLAVDHAQMVFSPDTPLEGASLTVTLPVHNTSDVPAGAFRATLYRGVPENGGVLLGTADFTGLAGNSTDTLTVTSPPLTGGGETVFCIVVDGDEAVTESREDDNKAFEVRTIKRLPDLTVTPGSLVLFPAVPVPGETLTAFLTVDNLGEQPAAAVDVVLYTVATDGTEVEVGAGQIAEVPAADKGLLNLSWTFAAGDVAALRLVVDPANTVPETNETNNEAEVPVQVQDRRFFASLRYISPNGDGVQDTVDLAFALDEAAILKIEIRDTYDRLVRTLEDGVLTGSARGTVTWDGRDDDGVLVRDGDFRVRLADEDDTLLGQLVLTVDTNRTPILDAIGTPAAYLTDLRCSVAQGGNYQFSADGAYLYADGITTLSGQNLRGVFRIAARGKGVDTLVDQTWLTQVAKPAGAGEYIGSIRPLPDGRVVFSTGFSNSCGNCDWALWLLESPTAEPIRLDVGPFTQFSVREASDRYVYINGYTGENNSGRVSLNPDEPGEIIRPGTQSPWIRGRVHGGVLAQDSFYGTYRDQSEYLDRLFFVPDDLSSPPVVLAEGPNLEVAVTRDLTGVAALVHTNYYVGGGGEKAEVVQYGDVTTWDLAGGTAVELYREELVFPSYYDYQIDWTPDNRLMVLDGPNGEIRLRDRHGLVQKTWPVPDALYKDYLEQITYLETYYRFERYQGFQGPQFDEHPLRWDDKGQHFFLVSELYVEQCIEIPSKACNIGFPEKAGPAFNGVHIAQVLRFALDEDAGTVLGNINLTGDEDIIFPNQLEGWTNPYRVDWLPRTDRLLIDGYDLGSLELLPEVGARDLGLGDFAALWPNIPGAMVKKLMVRNLPGAEDGPCDGGNEPWHVYESADNLLVHMEPGQVGLVLELKGVAADRNPGTYQVDWAYADAPDTWYAVTSPTRETVVDDLLADWVPPQPGNYLVRLTVRDMAGNVGRVTRNITWFDQASLAGVMAEPRFISPNGDGTQDAVTVRFRVLEPLHLDVTVENADGSVLRTLVGDYPLVTGETETLTWDGRDEAGNLVPDGAYLLRVQNRRFRIVVDTTPPVLTLQKPDVYTRNLKGNVVDVYKLTGSIEEPNLLEALVDFQGPHGGRHEYARINGSASESMYHLNYKLSAASFLNDPYRISAVDRAGNRALLDAQTYSPELLFKTYRQLRLEDGEPVVDRKGVPFLAKPFDEPADFPARPVGRHSSRLALEAIFAHPETPDAVFVDMALPGSHVPGQPVAWTSLEVDPQPVDTAENTDDEMLAPSGAAYNPHRLLVHLPFDLLLGNRIWLRLRVVHQGTEVASNAMDMLVEPTLRLGLVAADLEKAHAGELEPEEDAELVQTLAALAPLEDYTKTQVWVRESLTGTPSTVRLVVTSVDDARYAHPTVFLPRVSYALAEPSTFSGYLFEFTTAPCNTYQMYMEAEFPNPGGEPVFISSQDPVSGAKATFSRSCIEMEPTLKPVPGLACAGQPSGRIDLSVKLSTDRGQVPAAMNVYAEVPGMPPVLVANTPAPHVGVHTYRLDTTGFPEGMHRLRIEAVDTVGERTSVGTVFPVDRTPAQVSLDYPAEDARVCAEILPDGTLKLPLEGIVRDEGPVIFYASIGNGHDAVALKQINRPDPLDLSSPSAYFGELAAYTDPTAEGNPGHLRSGDVTARIEAMDWSGASVCITRRFELDVTVDARVEEDFGLISPNGDGNFDQTEISVIAFEPLFADVDVYEAATDALGNKVVVGAPITRLVEGLPISGEFPFAWAGTDADGLLLPDGDYALRFTLEDPCGLIDQFDSFGSLDTTPPDLALDYPLAGDPLGVLVEVVGSFQDLHFATVEVAFAEAESNPLWSRLELHRRAVEDSAVIARWPLTGLQGNYLLRLYGRDAAANTSELIVPIEITLPTVLIWGLDGEPRLFSPNGDGVLDATDIALGLQTEAVVRAEVLDAGNTVRALLLDDQLLPAGSNHLPWGGSGNTGTLPDGTYRVRVVARDPGSSFTQEAVLTLELDTVPPQLEVRNPGPGIQKPTGRFNLEWSDAHPNDVRLFTTNPQGVETAVLEARDNGSYGGGNLTDLSEDTHQLRAVARDRAGNTTTTAYAFTLDATPPEAALTLPVAQALVGGKQPLTAVEGIAADAHFAAYSLALQAEGSSTWTEIYRAEQAPTGALLYSWPVTGPDGAYLLRLQVSDLAGHVSEVLRPVTVDTTPPTAIITAPAPGSLVGRDTLILGTADDAHPAGYRVQLASVGIEDWTDLHAATDKVIDGTLMAWTTLPPDGTWALRLLVTDALGLTAEARTTLTLDTRPPEPPISLTAEVQPNFDVHLQWSPGPGGDTVGYRLYRNGLPITAEAVTGTTHTDPDVTQGTHRYHVTALDAAGNESAPSNIAKISVDRIPPEVALLTPTADKRVRGTVPVVGTATAPDDFYQYRLYVRLEGDPAPGELLRQSAVAAVAETLTGWDSTTAAQNAPYVFLLEAEDTHGNTAQVERRVVVDNLPPAAPTGLTATVQAGDDAAVSWNPNAESDLAGYLLYRNGLLANAVGQPGEDLSAFLLTATAYLDLALSDGPHQYVVYAVDTAGNTSAPSAPADVVVETGPPDAVFEEPTPGLRFDRALYVLARGLDRDIATIAFAYAPAGTTTWTDLGTPDDAAPFEARFDPQDAGLPYGDYTLRALAVDDGGLSDPTPALVTVTFTDLEAPDTLSAPSVLADGDAAVLTWTASDADDLLGYRVYAADADDPEATPVRVADNVTDTQFTHTGLQPGRYRYTVRVVDTYDNESPDSEPAMALIFAIEPDQPHSPTPADLLTLTGTSPVVGTVAGTLTDADGTVTPLGPAATDGQGGFVLADLPLGYGGNSLSLQLTDGAGNRSIVADLAVVRGQVPDPPVNPAAVPTGNTVSFSWEPAPVAPDAPAAAQPVGYYVARDGQVLQVEQNVTGISWTASTRGTYASRVGDNNRYSYWYPTDPDLQNPPEAWLQGSFSPRLITAVTLQFYYAEYAPTRFRVMGWDGSDWVQLARVTEPTGSYYYGFTLDQPFYTDRLRLVIDGYNPAYYIPVRVGEFQMRGPVLHPASPWQETLSDGIYSYTAATVNGYGFQSAPSAAVEVVVGDVVGPDPVVLSGSVNGVDTQLAWTASAAADTAGYRLYRDGYPVFVAPAAGPLSFTDTDLANGTYTYHVTAYDAVGNTSPDSNAVALTVAGDLPPAPVLSLTQNEGETHLLLDWTSAPAAAFDLRRAETSGGPYTTVFYDGEGQETAYTDRDTAHGHTYYYVVHAYDSRGNESAPSNEVSATVLDTTAPDAPVLHFPTRAGTVYVTEAEATAVGGTAEPGSRVTLRRNGSGVGTVFTPAEITEQALYLDNLYTNNVQISPDGRRMLAVDYPNTLFDLTTGTSTQLPFEGAQVFWAPDGGSFYAAGYAFSGQLRRYDLQGNLLATLLQWDTIEFAVPAPDGRTLAVGGEYYDADTDTYEAGIFVVTAEGAVLTRVPDIAFWALEAREVFWAPDGRGFAMVVDGSLLQFFEPADDSLTLLDGNAAPDSLSWHNDGVHLLFTGRDENDRIRVADTSDASVVTVPAPYEVNRVIGYSPDSARIAVLDGCCDVGILDPATGEETDWFGHFDWIDAAHWLGNGSVAVVSWRSYTTYAMPGYFSLPDMALAVGDNSVTAQAEDAAGNTSPLSDPIVIRVTGAGLPDLAVLAGDLTVLPAAGLPDQDFRVNLQVRNQGSGDAPATQLVLRLSHPDGQVTNLLPEGTLPALAAGARRDFHADLPGPHVPGTYRLTALVDGANTVREVSETNNLFEQTFRVQEQAAPVLSLALDRAEVPAEGPVTGTVEVYNGGTVFSGRMLLTAEDGLGYALGTVLDTDIQNLPYAQTLTLPVSWDISAVFAGDYRFKATLFDQAGTPIDLAEAGFRIGPAAAATLTLTLPRTSYLPYETVTPEAALHYDRGNTPITDGRLTWTVRNDADVVLDEAVTVLGTLLPGSDVTRTHDWNPAALPAGTYRVQCALTSTHAQASAELQITLLDPAQTLELTGSLTLTSRRVALGNPFTVGYSVVNSGDVAVAGVPLSLRLHRAANLAVVAEALATADLPVGAQASFEESFSSAQMALESYLLVLTADLSAYGGGASVVLASASLTGIDATPPLLEARSPLAGAVVGADVAVTAYARDLLTAVDTVELSVDGGTRVVMGLGGQPNLYRRTLFGLSEGSHTLAFSAVDTWSNSVDLPAYSFTVDLTAPVILIDGVADGQVGRLAVTPTVTVVEDHPGTTLIMLNGQPFVSGTTIDAEGTYLLTVTSVDAAGNSAERVVAFHIDRTAPPLTVTHPVPGAVVVVPTTAVTGTTEAGALVTVVNGAFSASVTAAGDGSFAFADVPLTPGANNLVVDASDAAGNQAPTVIVPVAYETPVAEVSGTLTLPADPVALGSDLAAAYMLTNTGNLALSERPVRALLFNGAFTVAEEGTVFTLTPGQSTSGSLSFATDGLAPGTYRVALQAMPATDWDELASGLVILADRTPPTVELLSPTSGALLPATFTLSATAEDGISEPVTVGFLLDGLTEQAMVLVDGAAHRYEGAATDVADGPHSLRLRAVDAAGNEAFTAPLSVEVDGTAPAITVTGIAEGEIYAAAVTPIVLIDDAHADTETVTLDGAPFTSGTPVSAEGPHTLAVHATDRVGNSAARTVSFTIDTTAPTVTVLSPADGAAVGQPRVDVTGTTEPGAFVTLVSAAATRQVQADTAGAFTFADVALSAGPNTLTLHAQDRAGNTGPDTSLTVHVVTDPPLVAWVAPAEGSVLSPDFDVAVTVTTQGYPVVRVELMIDALAAGNLTPDPGTPGAFYAQLTDIPAGAHTLRAVAVDTLGNEGHSPLLHVTVETPDLPLTITAPVDGAEVASDTVTVTGTSQDGALITLTAGGFSAQTSVSGGLWQVAGVPVGPGDNLIQVAAALDDAAAQASITVIGACSLCVGTPIVVDEDVVVDLAAGTYSGDPDLQPFLTLDTDGDPHTWTARFDLDGRSLTVTNGATITVASVPFARGEASPGLSLTGICRFQLDADSAVLVQGHNAATGTLTLESRGDMLLAGTVANRIEGTWGITGEVHVTSSCGDLHLTDTGRLLTDGTQEGARDMTVRTLSGDILVEGLIDVVYTWTRAPNLTVAAFAGDLTVDGRRFLGKDAVTGRPLAAGVSLRCRSGQPPGRLELLASGDITVHGYGDLPGSTEDAVTLNLDTTLRGDANAVPVTAVLTNSAPDTVTVDLTAASGKITALFGNLADGDLLGDLSFAGDDLNGKFQINENAVAGIPNAWISPPGYWDFGVGFLAAGTHPETVRFTLTAPGLVWQQLLAPQADHWALGVIVAPSGGKRDDTPARMGLRSPWFQEGRQFGTVAVKSKNQRGGMLHVQSLEGAVTASDHAFDHANSQNGDAVTLIEARGDVHLTRSAGAVLDGDRTVLDGRGSGAGATQIVRSHGGGITLDAGLTLTAAGTPDGTNLLEACTGVQQDGTVLPADPAPDDDSGACTPEDPPTLNAPPPTTAEVGSTYRHTLAWSGGSSDTRAVLLEGPAGLRLDGALLSWTPTADQEGVQEARLALFGAFGIHPLSLTVTVAGSLAGEK